LTLSGFIHIYIMGTAAVIGGKSTIQNDEFEDGTRENVVHNFDDLPEDNHHPEEKVFEERKQSTSSELMHGNTVGKSTTLQERKKSPKENVTIQHQKKITASEEYHLAITGKIPMMQLLENDDDLENLEDISIAKSKEKYETHSSKTSSSRPTEKLKAQNSSPVLNCNILAENDEYLSDEASNNSTYSTQLSYAQQKKNSTIQGNGSPISNPSVSATSSPMDHFSPHYQPMSPPHAKVPLLPLSAFKTAHNNTNSNKQHQNHGLYIFEDAENQLSLQRQKVISAMRNAEVRIL